MPVLTADDGAFNNILILGLDNCYKLMHKKLVQNTMGIKKGISRSFYEVKSVDCCLN